MAVYDHELAVKVLMDRDGMDYEEAVEYMDFNVTGGWLGAGTPAFLIRRELHDFLELIEFC